MGITLVVVIARAAHPARAGTEVARALINPAMKGGPAAIEWIALVGRGVIAAKVGIATLFLFQTSWWTGKG